MANRKDLAGSVALVRYPGLFISACAGPHIMQCFLLSLISEFHYGSLKVLSLSYLLRLVVRFVLGSSASHHSERI